jgi:hypothetical protein
MKKFVKHILKETIDERDLIIKGVKNIYENKEVKGLSKSELFIFNKLYSKKENPYTFPFEVYNFIKSLGYDDNESKELFTLYTNNYISSGEFDKLKNVDRSEKLHDEYFDLLFDDMFDPDELHWQNPYDYDDEGDEYEDMDRLEVYVGDYEDGENTIFRWYAPNYFSPNTENRNLAPFIELENLDLQNSLMETFGEDWIEPFKKWIKNNVGVKVKNILI